MIESKKQLPKTIMVSFVILQIGFSIKLFLKVLVKSFIFFFDPLIN